jgi:hypothetical protein
MSDAVEKLIGIASEPGTRAFRSVSDRVLQSRGADTYSTPLIPGFDETKGSDVLMVPTEETYAQQVAQGIAPHYVYENPFNNDVGKARKARKTYRLLSKLAIMLDPEGSTRPYRTTPNPDDGVRSHEEEYDNSQGIKSIWEGLNDLGQGSDSPEPSATNNILGGHGGS